MGPQVRELKRTNLEHHSLIFLQGINTSSPKRLNVIMTSPNRSGSHDLIKVVSGEEREQWGKGVSKCRCKRGRDDWMECIIYAGVENQLRQEDGYLIVKVWISSYPPNKQLLIICTGNIEPLKIFEKNVITNDFR